MGGAWNTEKWGLIAQRGIIARRDQLGGAREIEREQRNRSTEKWDGARSIQKRERLSRSGQMGGT